MDELTYLDFDLWFDRGPDGWRVRATGSDGRAIPAEPCRIPELTSRSPRDAGAQLFDAVFHGELLAFFSSFEAQDKSCLRLRLHLEDAPQLAGLPWEGLFHSRQRQFLALSVQTPIVRALEVRRPRPLAVRPPLRILVVYADPGPDGSRLRGEEELEGLRRTLGKLRRRGLVHIERARQPTLSYLHRRLRSEFHVLHFIGHGGQGTLLLEDEDRRPDPVTSEQLGVLLNDARSLSLVVLNTCSGAETPPRDALAGIAQTLAKRGIPAVVAMRQKVLDETAVRFSGELYKALADGCPIDAAVTEARKAIYLAGSPEWMKAALFLRPGDSRVLDVESFSVTDTHSSDLSPLIGRRQEVKELRRRLSAVRGGECRFVLVGGPEGVGKSRLLAELAELCAEQDLRVLHAHVAGPESALPYQWFCELVQRSLRHGCPDLSDLAAELVASFPVLSDVAELRALCEEAPRVRPSRPPEDPSALHELLARTLLRLGGGRPMALLIENVHRASASAGALQYLLQRLGSSPTLIACTYLPGDVTPSHPLHELRETLLSGSERASVLDLRDFTVAELRQWIARLLFGSPPETLDGELVEELFRATGGNPFFARELVSSLLETERIRQVHDRWVLVNPQGFAPMPQTIRKVIEDRAARLAEGPKKVLDVASVLGRELDERDLRRLADGEDVDAALDELVQRGFLEEGTAGAHELRFTSGVLRDLRYQGLGRQQCRRLHRRHAESLEQRYRDRPEPVLPQLVDHFSKTGVAGKTIGYAVRLARGALDAFSPESAIGALEKALDHVDEEDVRPDLHQLLAEAHSMAGRHQAALVAAELAADAFQRTGAASYAAGAALVAADAAWQNRDVGAAWRWIEIGCRLARDADAVEPLRRLLTLGMRLANLDNDLRTASACLAEIRKLDGSSSETARGEVPEDGSLVTALPYPAASLDPAASRTDGEMEVTACVFETLLAADAEHGIVVPGLAETWKSSQDHRSFELRLRSGITFSDSSPLLAQDVKASFKRARGVAWQTPAFASLEEVEARGELDLVFRLREPLPIFPALLSDPKTAVARASAAGALLGTGPFQVREHRPEAVVLERNPRSWRRRAPLRKIVFRTDLDAAGIAAALRRGDLDLGRDLRSDDLEGLAEERRWQWAEAPKANVYFVLFHHAGPKSLDAALREALLRSLRPADLVRRTLGRFARPATSWIPPGFPGHDPRPGTPAISRRRAREILDASGLPRPLVLRAAVHPVLEDRYAALTEALTAEWSELGVEIETVAATMGSFLAHVDEKSREVDLLIGRWSADYVEPEAFTYGLFHSQHGVLRRYFSSAEGDYWLAQARQAPALEGRLVAHRRFESVLAREHVLLPLFHDVDVRVASPEIRGLRLRATPPYVGYSALGKAAPPPFPGRAHGGEVRVPIASRLTSLDPASEMLIDRLEVTSNVFESLTRIDEHGRAEPWLAESCETLDGARSYHFRLRPEVYFHDGRVLGAEDVLASFRRVLERPQSNADFLVLPIRGARALRDGESRELAGFRILSPSEFSVELERPLPHFPALLSSPALGIVPEGSGELDGRNGCAGTGPFQVARFDPGEQLVLERHPGYWRRGYPLSQRLVFQFGLSPERVYRDFKNGDLDLASGLTPARVAKLRQDPRFLPGYREWPRLSTYFLVLNTRQGPFADRERRAAFCRMVDSLDVVAALREAGHDGVKRARGLIPPELLKVPEGPSRGSGDGAALRGLRLRAVVHPEYAGPYADLWDRLGRHCAESGVTLRTTHGEIYDLLRRARDGGADLIAIRFLPIYPHVDGFVSTLLHSEEGLLAGNFGSPEVDARIAEAEGAATAGERRQIYGQIETVLRRESLLVPLFHEKIYRFLHPGFEGLLFGPTVPEVYYERLRFEGRR